jgi:SpoVK/Ycf46/Vps4 family AAA+-type ATPase
MNAETLPTLPNTPAAQLALTPSQQACLAQVEAAIGVASTIALTGPAGSGRSTLVAHLAARHRGKIIDLSSIADALVGASPSRTDELIGQCVLEAMRRYDMVIIDDYERVFGQKTSEREDFLRKVIVPHLYDAAAAQGKTLVLAGSAGEDVWWMPISELFGDRATRLTVPAFSSDDYAAIATHILGAERLDKVDFRVLHKHASMLDGYQLRLLCQLVANERELTTDTFAACLQEWILCTNLDLSEVEALSFDSLPGAEYIAEALETHVVLPFENRELATEMGLKPKRGVLLYGPPGTGKTSIGRALAHRMKGKFFMIDGTFISEPPTVFFGSVQAIVAEAKANAPSVLFIDDADVLFGIEHIGGLSRYLLSLLDGLESESASNVCVVMTAMDVRRVPEALLRSGRVELWLETRPPEPEVRARILQRWMSTELPGHEAIDYQRLATMTQGFTPADLRRIAGDAKLLYAADVVAKAPLKDATAYLAAAIEEIIAVRGRMADQLGDDALRVGQPA